MALGVAVLGPVQVRARIEVIDIMRGIAILGILYMNIPFMGTSVTSWLDDIRRLSWSPADQATWTAIAVFWDGTQRGLFEFLFGAGVMVLTARAMRPDDPVAVADLFYRRNLLLIGFGLIDIFLIGWIGDILLAYGLAALFLFPFRKASPRWLLALGLLFTAFTVVGGIGGYQDQIAQIDKVAKLEARQAAGTRLNDEDAKTVTKWQEKRDAHDLTKPRSAQAKAMIKEETEAHANGPWTFLGFAWGTWNKVFGDGNGLFFTVLEALCAMFIGMALWKWGVIQGERPRRFYALVALLAYAVGLGLRAWDASQVLAFSVFPTIGSITGEVARLSVTLGHVALFNLLVKTRRGHRILSPFRAAGRMAFSIYILTSVATLWFVFAPWGLNLWDRFGWAELMVAATAVNVFMLVFANIWLRYFLSGPLEWVWRSLAYGKRQPFVRGGPRQPAAEVSGASFTA